MTWKVSSSHTYRPSWEISDDDDRRADDRTGTGRAKRRVRQSAASVKLWARRADGGDSAACGRTAAGRRAWLHRRRSVGLWAVPGRRQDRRPVRRQPRGFVTLAPRRERVTPPTLEGGAVAHAAAAQPATKEAAMGQGRHRARTGPGAMAGIVLAAAAAAAAGCGVPPVGEFPWSAETVQARMDVLGVPAVSVAVIDGLEIAWAGAYGVLETPDGPPADTGTLFQTASVGKSAGSHERADPGRDRCPRPRPGRDHLPAHLDAAPGRSVVDQPGDPAPPAQPHRGHNRDRPRRLPRQDVAAHVGPDPCWTAAGQLASRAGGGAAGEGLPLLEPRLPGCPEGPGGHHGRYHSPTSSRTPCSTRSG